MKTALIFAMTILLTLTTGCIRRPPEADKAQDLKRRALQQYVENTNAVHRAEQETYLAVERKHAQTLFDNGLMQLKLKAGPDGKVDAADAAAWVQTLLASRDKYIEDAHANVSSIRATIDVVDRDMYTALKLDDLVERFAKQGIDPALIQSAVDSILSLTKKR